MEEELRAARDEIKRLQSCINDLTSVQALAAVWHGREPPEIVAELVEMLLRILRADFVYARAGASLAGAPIEAVRLPERESPAEADAIKSAVAALLIGPSFIAPHAVANPIGKGDMRIAHATLGVAGKGAVLAGSQRADFATQTEKLLLQVAANQAAIALHEARRLREQKRAAAELERRVAERTGQLTTVYQELKAEIGERRRTEDALAQAQADLVRVSRITTMGELSASIAHEVNQPLSAVITNAMAGLSWLSGAAPNREEAQAALRRIVRDAKRATEVVGGIRAFLRRTDAEKQRLDVNEVIREVTALAQSAIRKHLIELQTELAEHLPLVLVDRVQLQQVVLNLVMTKRGAR